MPSETSGQIIARHGCLRQPGPGVPGMCWQLNVLSCLTSLPNSTCDPCFQAPRRNLSPPKDLRSKATARRGLSYHVPHCNIEYSICDGLQLFRNDDMRSKRRSCESDEVSQDKRSQSVNCVNNFSAIFAFAIEAVDQCLSVLLMS